MNTQLARTIGYSVVLGTLALSSCQDFFTTSSSSCEGVIVTDYYVKGLTLELLNNDAQMTVIESPSQFNGNINDILFNFNIQYDEHNTELSDNTFNFSLIPKAHACSVVQSPTPVSQVKSISVTSNELSTIEADLNSDFIVYSISNNVFPTQENSHNLNEFDNINNEHYYEKLDNFKLLSNSLEVSSEISTASFVFKVEMEDGAIYELNSGQINF